MNAEKMDYLMTLEQWRLMRDGHKEEDRKDIDVEKVDDMEL